MTTIYEGNFQALSFKWNKVIVPSTEDHLHANGNETMARSYIPYIQK